MTTSDIVSCSKAMAEATTRRNAAVKELHLETSESDIIRATLYSPLVSDSSPSDVTDETGNGEDALEPTGQN